MQQTLSRLAPGSQERARFVRAFEQQLGSALAKLTDRSSTAVRLAAPAKQRTRPKSSDSALESAAIARAAAGTGG